MRDSHHQTSSDQSAIKAQPFVVMVVAVSLGLMTDHFIDLTITFYGTVGVIGTLTWIWFVSRNQLTISTIALMLVWCSVAATWHHAYWNFYGETDISFYSHPHSELACLKMRLESEPRLVAAKNQSELSPLPSSEQTRHFAKAISIKENRQWRKVSGNLEVVIHSKLRAFKSGDTVIAHGRLVSADAPRNPGQFDFREFYRCRRQLATLHVFQVEAITAMEKEASGWPSISGVRASLRRQFDQLTWEYIEHERAGFASAILLGNRQQLDSQKRELFLMTGTVHLLAISGLHIGILAGLFWALFRIGLLGRRTALISTILFVVFYAWLVEFRPPVLRAAILIVLYCLSRLLGRGGLSFNLLALAALIVLAINPTDLFQTGPQLSFLAVATIIACGPWIYSKKGRDPLQSLIRNTRGWPVRCWHWAVERAWITFKVSAVIWLVALPLVAFHFHLIVPVALVINPLVMIPISLALFSGFGVLVFGGIFSPLAKLLGGFCDWNLSLIEAMIQWGQSIPGSHFWTAGPGVVSMVVFYSLFLLMVVYPKKPIAARWLITLVVVWFSIGWVMPNLRMANRSYNKECVELTFIDTGHGGSTLIQVPNNKNILYDAGCFSSPEYAVANISGVLWANEIVHLDALVISHGDVDHFNAAIELCRRFSIGTVFVNEKMAQSESNAILCFRKELERQQITCRTLHSEKRLVLGSENVSITVLGPDKNGYSDNDNSNSLVLLLEAFGKSVLLPGDLEGEGMDKILQKGPLQVDVVMAPHHGSKNSSPLLFNQWARPANMVVSCSRQKTDWDVVKLIEGLGSRVFLTSRDGAIRCRLSNQGVALEKWIQRDTADLAFFRDRGFQRQQQDDVSRLPTIRWAKR